MGNLIEAKNVTKKFSLGGIIHKKTLTAVENFSLEIQEDRQTVTTLAGESGSGKTTTVRLISGIMDLTSGRVSVDGIDISENIEKVRNLIGYMPQKFSLYEDLSVEENIHFFADLYSVPKEKRNQRIRELYKFSRLEDFKDRIGLHLSGGMQKKLALMCTLINFPKVLILDEPSIGIDPVSRQELWEMLITLNKEQGITILVTTSYMDEVEKFDRTGLIYEGKFLICDKPQNIIKGKHTFEDAFISKIEELKKVRQ